MGNLNRQIPEKMLAIRQQEANGKLVMEELPVPRPGAGEVLVKMACAPINPSDLSLLKGRYPDRSYPFTPGLEGSGTVIRSGGGWLGKARTGKRVALTPDQGADGTWAEYLLTSALRTIPLPRELSLEQGSMSIVNPMTALAFLHLAREGKHRALVNNAAASSLGRMLMKLCAENDLPLINIVRKEAHRAELMELGASHVLNSMDASFESDLKQLSTKLKASLFLDAVGGQQSGKLLRAAPPHATLLVYARLSGDPLQFDPADLIQEQKKIHGFQLGNWLLTKGILFKWRFITQLKKQLSSTLSSRVNREFPLTEVEDAIRYYREHSSRGKIILKID